MVGNQLVWKYITFRYPLVKAFIKGVMTLAFGLMTKMGQDNAF
jgi:hypothetical protein